MPGFVALAHRLADNLDGAAGGGDAAVTLAAFHTLFNVLGVALLLPFAGRFSRMVARAVPERRGVVTRYLDSSVGEIGPVAVEAARRTAHDIAVRVVAALDARLQGRPRAGEAQELDEAREAVVEARRFLGRLQHSSDVEADRTRHLGVLHALDHLEELVDAAATAPALPALREVPGPRGSVASTLRATAAWLSAGEGEAPVDLAATAADRTSQEVVANRRRILDQTAEGRLHPEVADARIGALRWLDRVARHLARVVFYLG